MHVKRKDITGANMKKLVIKRDVSILVAFFFCSK